MRPVVLLGCLLLHAAELRSAGPATIRSVSFSGAAAIGYRALREAVVSNEGSLLSRQQLSKDAESILRLYYSRGYYRAVVIPERPVYTPDSSIADLTFTIREGLPSEVAAVRVSGNSSIPSDQILRGFETRAGAPLDRGTLERDIDRLLAAYERMGRPFARVEIQNIGPVSDSASPDLNVDLQIDEGPAVTVDEVTVQGNHETRDWVILREARMRLHEPYDEEKVKQIGDRLRRMGLFASVPEPELYMLNGTGRAQGSGGVLIKVEEGNTSSFDGVLGYAPPVPGGQDGAVSGIVTVSMRSLFGTARRLDVHWQRDNPQSQEVALRYTEPWVFDLPVTLTGGFTQRQQDSVYIARGFEAKADLLLTESVTLGGVFNHSAVIPSDNQAGRSVSNSRTITAGLDLRIDTRDEPASPTSGALYRTAYRIGTKEVFAASDEETVQTVGLDADLYASTFQRQVLAVGLHGRQITADRIELSDLFRFGGTNTLRGYRENEFLGSRVAWTNTEYRFLLARRSFFYGFVDAGYFFLPDEAASPGGSLQQFKAGYGIGIRLETAIGSIGVSIAFGEGDSFGEGKLHFGLANDF